MHDPPAVPDEPRLRDAARSLVAAGHRHRDTQHAGAVEPRKAGRRQALFLGLAGLASLAAPRPAGGSERPARDQSLYSLRRVAVGPDREHTTLALAAQNARDGDLIEVDAGDYRHDVAVWAQHGITLRALGGRVRLYADGAAAEGKAIWVVRAQGMHATGFDFIGCHVPPTTAQASDLRPVR